MRNRAIHLSTILAVAAAFLTGCGGTPPNTVEVKIAVGDTTPALKRATISVDYARSGARVASKGGQPACTSILPHVSCRFADAGGTLTIEAESPQGFSGPADVAVCRMIPDSPDVDAAKIGSRLRVAVVDARGGDGQPIAIASAARDPERATGSAPSRVDTQPEPGALDPAVGGGQATGAGSGAAGGAAAGSGEQGMVVTREDLQQREQRRAEEQLKQRQAATAARGGSSADSLAPGAGIASDAGEALIDEPELGSGHNDPTDDDPKAIAYTVSFELAATPGPLGALQFDVDYSGGSGGWLGAGASADCRWLIAAALHACNDKRGGSLTCAVVDTNGFSGPTALMECGFKSRNSVAAGDFSVRVTDASNPDSEPTNARVLVSGVYPR